MTYCSEKYNGKQNCKSMSLPDGTIPNPRLVDDLSDINKITCHLLHLSNISNIIKCHLLPLNNVIMCHLLHLKWTGIDLEID